MNIDPKAVAEKLRDKANVLFGEAIELENMADSLDLQPDVSPAMQTLIDAAGCVNGSCDD